MDYQTLPYNQSLALLTDFYQLTMAYGYWKTENSTKESVFHLYFRRNPFKGGFAIACGLNLVIDFLEKFKFDDSDIEYLGSLKGNDNKPLFEEKFLAYLRQLHFECDVDAIPEGTVVFAYEPLIRVTGPIIQCQILETVLLNIINFQTLVATKAARICEAAKGSPVLEFGLRRSQGIDGGLAASRAAYIGGCIATSNVLAGKIFGIPVKGTHGHSWIMSFDDELESFKAYASALPSNCIFLVDTYNTLSGIHNAVNVGKYLREQGHELAGIRLDSGDLHYWSNEARRILDEQGFPKTKIIVSNELDEEIIDSLKQQGAKVDLWGVGTKLVTAFDQPALDGVYKLSAVRSINGEWKYKVKISEQFIKVSNPGIMQVRRYFSGEENVADAIYDIHTDLSAGCTIIDPFNATRQKRISATTACHDLLVPVFRKGRRVYTPPPLDQIRGSVQNNLRRFHMAIKRFINPHEYPVGLEQSFYNLKNELILKTQESSATTSELS